MKKQISLEKKDLLISILIFVSAFYTVSCVNEEKLDLFLAIREGNVEDVEKYLNHGLDIETTDELGGTPLNSAIRNRKIEVVQLLLQSGADVNNRGGYWLDWGTPSYRWTPLSNALNNDSLAIAELLLVNDADPNCVDPFGLPELIVAAGSGKLTHVKLLVKYGADISVVDDNGNSARDLAAKKGHEEVVKYLDSMLINKTKTEKR